MDVVFPPQTPSLIISGAAFYFWTFAGNKSPGLWGFLGVDAATRGSGAAREGSEGKSFSRFVKKRSPTWEEDEPGICFVFTVGKEFFPFSPSQG